VVSGLLLLSKRHVGRRLVREVVARRTPLLDRGGELGERVVVDLVREVDVDARPDAPVAGARFLVAAEVFSGVEPAGDRDLDALDVEVEVRCYRANRRVETAASGGEQVLDRHRAGDLHPPCRVGVTHHPSQRPNGRKPSTSLGSAPPTVTPDIGEDTVSGR